MEMEQVFEKLQVLQDILSEKISIERNIQEIPKELSTQEELLSRLKKTFVDKHLEYEKAKHAENEFRELLMDAEAAREKAEKNMDVINTQREYEALDKEIHDAAEKESHFRKDLQREEKKLAELDEVMKQTSALIERQEQELEERRRGIEADLAEKRQQMEALAGKEREITAELDPEVFFKFERIIRNKGGKGIVAIRGGVCMGCHMILPIQFANDVRLGKEIVFCPYCSRILFYEESGEEGENLFESEESGLAADLDDEDDDYEDEEEEEDKDSYDFDE